MRRDHLADPHQRSTAAGRSPPQSEGPPVAWLLEQRGEPAADCVSSVRTPSVQHRPSPSHRTRDRPPKPFHRLRRNPAGGGGHLPWQRALLPRLHPRCSRPRRSQPCCSCRLREADCRRGEGRSPRSQPRWPGQPCALPPARHPPEPELHRFRPRLGLRSIHSCASLLEPLIAPCQPPPGLAAQNGSERTQALQIMHRTKIIYMRHHGLRPLRLRLISFPPQERVEPDQAPAGLVKPLHLVGKLAAAFAIESIRNQENQGSLAEHPARPVAVKVFQ